MEVVRLTPSKKWIPWDCTVCSFQSHSVCAMQRHMVEHTVDVLLRYNPKSPRGLSCPFCGKYTYGYNMSGLRRHLATPPTQHCQLKENNALFNRILEIARVNCRASLLEPSMKWSSWTDRNVYIAYHGCEPPPPTPRERLTDSPAGTEVRDEHSASESETREKSNPEETTSPSQPTSEEPTPTSSDCKEKTHMVESDESEQEHTKPLRPANTLKAALSTHGCMS